MNDFEAVTIGISIFLIVVISWSIGLAPPLLIRYVFLRRPMNKWPAIGTCSLFWFLNIFFSILLGSTSRTHAGVSLVALISYWILRKPTKVESKVELSSEIATNKSDIVENKRVNTKVFKTIGGMALSAFIVLIVLVGFVGFYAKLQKEKELNFSTFGADWEWHDKNYRIQIAKYPSGQSVLRKVNLSKKYIVFASKNKDLSLSTAVFFIVDCQPNTKITTSQTFSDGSPIILECNKDGDFLAYAVSWKGKDSDIIWEENLDGFNFKEDLRHWDFTKLDREITLSNSK